jgi:hypothetical protein
MKVALFTGGKDMPYVLGLVPEFTARGVQVALVGNQEFAKVANVRSDRVELHDLVGGLDSDEGLISKVSRVLSYYAA